ncbi:hypothetical protein ANO11243_071500 [Dothideomycetidae sp. 11243]|nr:hypothetical protein ANO11243_071500 [fungal sp. No.11243]
MSAPSMASTKPVYSKRRAGTLAKVACVGCRRLKMKCITMSDDLPCLRCAKAQRRCEQPPQPPKNPRAGPPGPSPPLTPLEHPMTDASSSNNNNNSNSNNNNSNEEHSWSFNNPASTVSITRSFTTPNLTTMASAISPALPSPDFSDHWPTSPFASDHISQFTSPNPLGITIAQAPQIPSFSPIEMSERTVSAGGGSNTSSVCGSNSNSNSSRQDPISLQEFRHLISFFVRNFMGQVAVLAEEDVADVAATIERKRALAISMSYVAAHFVPGCKSIRAKLTPAVVSIATLQTQPGERDNNSSDEARWSTLQALAVLYTWAPSRTPGLATSTRMELTRDMLRMSIESLAVRHAMHKSAQDVTELSKHTSEDELARSFVFRKYTYWLWMYTEAHLRSLLLRAPSTLREDASITNASKILDRMLRYDHVHRLVARVELCLVWVRADLRERDFGDWHCSTPNELGADTAMAVLGEMDDDLRTWRRQWCTPQGQSPSSSPSQPDTLTEAILGLYQHFIHYCNALYVAQAFRASSSAVESVPAATNFDRQALQRALLFCQSFCELNPSIKASIGYSPETLFSMAVTCCDSVIQTCASSTFTGQTTTPPVTVVLDVAELMIEAGPDDTHSSRVLGQRVLGRYLRSMPVSNKASPSSVSGRALNQHITQIQTPSYRPALHQRACSADMLNFGSTFRMGSENDSSGNSGNTSISPSPELRITIPFDNSPRKSWSASHDNLLGMDLTDGLDADMIDLPFEDHARVYAMHTNTFWAHDTNIPPTPNFF